jgi:hypothetical protein
MPKPSDYTPARRYMMQVVMVLLLGGTIALAAVVSRSARRANQVKLSTEPVSDRGISVFPPAGWKLMPRGDDPRVIAIAAQNPHERQTQAVEIFAEQLSHPLSPLQYLVETEGLPDSGQNDPDAELGADPAITMASQQGVLVMAQGMSGDPRGRMTPVSHIYACAITPSLQAIVVHLSSPQAPEPRDLDLVRQIARSITLTDPPHLGREGASVQLGWQITCTAPSGFAGVDQRDSNRTDRLLWPMLGAQGTCEQLERNWATIELVGCLCQDFDSSDPKQRAQGTDAMLTLLAAHDSAWRAAEVKADGDGQWQAELPGQSNGFPARAFLRTDRSGYALLAIFRGGHNGGGVDEAWKQISSSIHFPSSSAKIAQLRSAGAQEASRLRSQGYEFLLADRDEQWWLLIDSSPRPHIGWSHLDFQLNMRSARGESRMRLPAGQIQRITRQWAYRDGPAPAAGQYRADMVREISGGRADNAIQQTTSVRNGQFATVVRSAHGRRESTLSLPDAFVPGELLPLLMGRLPDTPMLLRTESFPTCQACGAPEPLTILIRRDSQSTRKAEGQAQPMRCLSAEVNGSGRLSRWYFGSDGELECIELPGEIQQLPSDSHTIGFDFADDRMMTP